MRDLTSPGLMTLKAVLLLLAGALAGALLWIDRPTLRTGGLLVACVWASCRAYYFAFYVVERYVDRSYRFSGIGSLVAHALAARRRPQNNGGR